jgi:hypothetical protein
MVDGIGSAPLSDEWLGSSARRLHGAWSPAPARFPSFHPTAGAVCIVTRCGRREAGVLWRHQRTGRLYDPTTAHRLDARFDFAVSWPPPAGTGADAMELLWWRRRLSQRAAKPPGVPPGKFKPATEGRTGCCGCHAWPAGGISRDVWQPPCCTGVAGQPA